MTRLADSLILAAIISALGLGSCLDACGTRVEAQSRATRDERAVVTLAQMLCGEADAHVADYAPILHTMQRRATAHGLSLAAMARAYSAPLRGQGGSRGRWVRALPVLPTPAYATTWQTALDTVRAFLRGEVSDPCERETLHFGSPRDARRRFPFAHPVDCGGTRNLFFGGVP